jgi:hypothetical protein
MKRTKIYSLINADKIRKKGLKVKYPAPGITRAAIPT